MFSRQPLDTAKAVARGGSSAASSGREHDAYGVLGLKPIWWPLMLMALAIVVFVHAARVVPWRAIRVVNRCGGRRRASWERSMRIP